jgi:amidase
MEDFAPNAALANAAGLPALALPFGTAGAHPLSVQIMGPIGSDATLLELGARLERLRPTPAFPHPVAGLA